MNYYVANRTTFAPLLSCGDKHPPPASGDDDHDGTSQRRPPIAARALEAGGQLHSAIEQQKSDEVMDKILNSDEVSAEQLAVSVDDAQLYAEYRRLADEQAAMRRVAALVARGVEPSEVFDAVTNEMRGYLHAATAGLWRFETTGEITLLSVAAYLPDGAMKWPVGTRTPIEGNTLAAVVQSTRRARPDGQLRQCRRSGRRARPRGGPARCGGSARSSSMDACGAWRPSARTGPARCRPTPRPGSAGSPNLSRVRWWPDTATSRNGRWSARHRSARC